MNSKTDPERKEKERAWIAWFSETEKLLLTPGYRAIFVKRAEEKKVPVNS